MNVTPIDLANFVIANRGTKGFVGWTHEQVCKATVERIPTNCVCYACNEIEVTGLMLGHIKDGCIFWVDNILSTEKGNMWSFIQFILKHFPTISIIATQRHGRFYKEYKIDKRTFNKFSKGLNHG